MAGAAKKFNLTELLNQRSKEAGEQQKTEQQQAAAGADYWYQKNTRAAAVILDSKCNGLAQRRSDADIRKQAQHHPAYTEADILFVAAEQAEKILVYHSIFPHGLFASVQGRKFQISVN